MATHSTRGWRTTGFVVPLLLVIGAALYWSSYATYHSAIGPDVNKPIVSHDVAVMLFLSLDGAVLVTTPVMISTVLSKHVRVFAGLIGGGALLFSMVLSISETDWVGAAPPLLAGLLIHLVGQVLRDFRDADDREAKAAADKLLADKPSAPPVIETVVATAQVERVTPTAVSAKAGPELKALPQAPAQPTVSLEKNTATPNPSIPSGLDKQDVVFWMMNEAHAKGWPEPTGPELTDQVRAAGYTVNDNYGRTTKARWRTAREEVRVSEQGQEVEGGSLQGEVAPEGSSASPTVGA